jgi:hypothetical protein
LKLIESLLIRVHLVSVVRLSVVHHLLMVAHHLVDLVLVVPLHFLLVLKELLIPVVVLDFFVLNLRRQLSNFLVFPVKLSLNSGLFVLLHDLNLVFEMLNIGLELVSLLFLNQNLLR